MHVTTKKIINQHKASKSPQRLGQYFCNRYIKREDKTTESLFNEPNDHIAANIIDLWMDNNNYREELPPLDLKEHT